MGNRQERPGALDAKHAPLGLSRQREHTLRRELVFAHPIQRDLEVGDDGQRDEPVGTGPAPVLDVPVVVGLQHGERELVVQPLDVLDGKINVLYVDGYPRWEYRYIKNEIDIYWEDGKLLVEELSGTGG